VLAHELGNHVHGISEEQRAAGWGQLWILAENFVLHDAVETTHLFEKLCPTSPILPLLCCLDVL